jgi:anti-anti-sigma factor
VVQLEVTQDVHGDAVVLRVAGEIDSSTVVELADRLDSAFTAASEDSSRLLVVDLSGVTYFGSAGLNSILDFYQRGRAAGVAVRVVANSAQVIRPMQVTKLDEVLRPYSTLDDAVDGPDEAAG